MSRFFYCLCLSMLLIGCHTSHQKGLANHKSNDNLFQYARHISSHVGSDSIVVYLEQNELRDSLIYIIDKQCDRKKRLVVLSTTDIAFLSALQQIDCIVGVCDPFRICDSIVLQKVRDGQIQNVGTSMEINPEQIAALHPDAVIVSAYSLADVQKYEKFRLSWGNIPVFYTLNWQEETLLGRAEWIKFLGKIVGKCDEAEKIFQGVEQKYKDLQQSVEQVTKRPVVLAGEAYNDVWYMPGGRSYIANCIRDAGGTFVNANDTHIGSTMMSFEQIVCLDQDVDLWIGCSQTTMQELCATNKNYSLLHVVREGNIYHRSKRMNQFGGNAFWEYGTVHPELILADYISVIHPEIVTDYTTFFLGKVE